MTTIEPFDAATASDDELRDYYVLDVALEHEVEPDDPTPPFERAALDYREPPSWTSHRRWVARDERGGIVGRARLDLKYLESNRHIAEFDIGVHTEHRRHGIATQLLRPLVEAAAADGRSILESWTSVDTPGDAFAASLGQDTRYVERRSRLEIGGLDRTMLEDWTVRAKERAADYSLIGFDVVCPDDLLDRYLAAIDVMNTAPREDLEMEDDHETPERLREREARAIKRGDVGWSLLARHDPTGHIAGFTEIEWVSYATDLAWQGGTAVDPGHRDKGLGRWLKAAMLLRLLDERPNIRRIDTWNAGTNEPMLAINIALGFAPVKYYNARQFPTAELAARLG
ncbi:MAG TPA: GNAT family N-acetyltransferase [Acidimicrobiales bacterium]|nr:GNAT family N-acetyltransferase [Acidimicrobiales bacterium]